MKNRIKIVALFLSILFFGCGDDKETVPVALNIEKKEVFLLPGQSIDVKIIEGNSGYLAEPINNEVATATITNDVVHITASSQTERGTTSIIITDKQFQRAAIDVVVAKEFDLILSHNSLQLELGIVDKDEKTIVIEKGNFDYTVELLDDGADYITLNTENQISFSRFSVKAKALIPDGKKVQIEVKDAKGKKALVEVSIISPQKLEVNNHSLAFETPQVSKEIQVNTGTEPFSVDIAHPSIAEVRVEGNKIKVTSRLAGNTTFIVRDKLGFTSAPISVAVTAPDYGMNLGTNFFCHASFQELATVDMSIKSLRATTWEMRCKIDSYRGLQTFMGLEGKLIVRGKNDDYRDTHPIEIAGLGDKIILLTKESFELNKWMHLALVVDCSQSSTTEKYKLYVNGKEMELEVNREEETHTNVDITSSNDDNKFEIGLASKQDWRAMRGSVSEVRIWKTARTPEQIKNNICRLNDVAPAGLLARWDFSVGIATDYIQDSSGTPYPTNLTLSKVGPDDGTLFSPTFIPLSIYLDKECVE